MIYCDINKTAEDDKSSEKPPRPPWFPQSPVVDFSWKLMNFQQLLFQRRGSAGSAGASRHWFDTTIWVWLFKTTLTDCLVLSILVGTLAKKIKKLSFLSFLYFTQDCSIDSRFGPFPWFLSRLRQPAPPPRSAPVWKFCSCTCTSTHHPQVLYVKLTNLRIA